MPPKNSDGKRLLSYFHTNLNTDEFYSLYLPFSETSKNELPSQSGPQTSLVLRRGTLYPM